MGGGRLILSRERLQRAAADGGFQVESYEKSLVRETRELMAAELPPADRELEFLERLNGAGYIAPEVLTDVPAIQAIIRDHPGLEWKALNVKKRLGVVVADGEPTEWISR